MDITNGSLRYHLSEKEYTKSPYLTGLKSYSENAEVPMLDGAYVLGCDNECFEGIADFLKYNRCNVTEENYHMYELLGFPNHLGYDLDYFNAMLQDKIDPMRYVEDCSNLFTCCENTLARVLKVITELYEMTQDIQGYPVIYGDAVVRMIKGVSVESIDVAFIHHSSESIVDLSTYLKRVIKNNLGYTSNMSTTVLINDIRVVISHVSYESIGDLVQSQPIDCLGICYEHEDFGFCMTRKARYALKNSCNWVHPELLTDDYTNQLLRYAYMNFKVKLPSFYSRGCIDLSDMCRKTLLSYMISSSSKITEHRWMNESAKMLAIRLIHLFDLGDMINLSDSSDASYEHLTRILSSYPCPRRVVCSNTVSMTTGTVDMYSDHVFIVCLLNVLIQLGTRVKPKLSNIERLILSHDEGIHDLPASLVTSIDTQCKPFTIYNPKCSVYSVRSDPVDISIDELEDMYTTSSLTYAVDNDDGLTSERYNIFKTRSACAPLKMLYSNSTPRLGCHVYNVRLVQCLVDRVPDISLMQYNEYLREDKLLDLKPEDGTKIN